MTAPGEVVVIATGTANLASVLAALRRAGASPRVSSDPEDADSALALVLPGVGAFGAAMSNLARAGLAEPLRRRLQQARATLAICLGFQILFEASEESPGVQGLGVLPGVVRRFPASAPRVPQMGWNLARADASCTLLRDAHVYYANSFRVDAASWRPPSSEPGWHAARTDYAGPFIAGAERGPVLACQFHPELSGPAGKDLLDRWLSRAGVERVKEPLAC